MKFYDWSKRDWLGIEAIKGMKDYDGIKPIGRIIARALKRSEPVLFLFLSVWFDAFVTTAYLLKGKFNSMNKGDWTIFVGSLLISNAYWILACYMGISLFEWVWRMAAG